VQGIAVMTLPMRIVVSQACRLHRTLFGGGLWRGSMNVNILSDCINTKYKNMKPIEFKEQNAIFAKNQPQYRPLPALKLNNGDGDVISCWKLTVPERLKVLFTGKIWVGEKTFNEPLTPILLSPAMKKITE